MATLTLDGKTIKNKIENKNNQTNRNKIKKKN